MTPTSPHKLHAVWTQMLANRARLGQTVLEMLQHPDATQEQVLSAADRYRRVSASLREVQPKVVAALLKKGYPMLAGQVQSSLTVRS